MFAFQRLDPSICRIQRACDKVDLVLRLVAVPMNLYLLPRLALQIVVITRNVQLCRVHAAFSGIQLGDAIRPSIKRGQAQYRGDGSSYLGVSNSGKPITLSYDIDTHIPPNSESVDFPLLFALLGSPTIGDLRGDGAREVVAGTAGTIKLIDAQAPARQEPGDNQITAWDPETGHVLDNFPRKIEDLMFFGNPTIADLDGDGVPEIVTGSGGGLVHAVNAAGAQPTGWPKFTNNWMIPIPVVGDIDGDGLLEVAASSREGAFTVWEATGSASSTAVQWNGFRHDRQRTGNVDSGVPPGLVPANCTAGTFPLALHVTRVSHGHLPNTDKIKVRDVAEIVAESL